MNDEQKLDILRQIIDKVEDITRLVTILGDDIYKNIDDDDLTN